MGEISFFFFSNWGNVGSFVFFFIYLFWDFLEVSVLEEKR